MRATAPSTNWSPAGRRRTGPDVFTQDDDGFGTVLPGREDGGGGALVRVAARACPVRAVSVRDTADGPRA
ncbi:ferredoxin [Streptomyces wedmorensis]|uniref:ferredoxin n=1 Tax=Streptomyces wedmorensis TaxID=43759 RepID=UPI003428B6B4